jgi:hypothetical protein
MLRISLHSKINVADGKNTIFIVKEIKRRLVSGNSSHHYVVKYFYSRSLRAKTIRICNIIIICGSLSVENFVSNIRGRI